jgi:dihydrodipicolinate synthase/N-acetylneuraminate lyase
MVSLMKLDNLACLSMLVRELYQLAHIQRLIEEPGALKILFGYKGLLEREMRVDAAGVIAGSANVLLEIIKGIICHNNE